MLSEYHAFVFYQQNQTLKSTNSVANEKNSKQMHEGILPREIWR